MDWKEFLKNDRNRLIIFGSVAVVLLGVLLFVNLSSAVGGAISDLAPQLVVLACTLVASGLVARFAKQALDRALAVA